MAISPTAQGFRAAFRRPSLTLAEITWRWTTGATTIALLAFGLFEYLSTLPVTNGELLFLRTRQPYLVGEAIAHILRGTLNRAVMAGLVAALMLACLWIVAASVGRIATVRGLLDYFRRDVAGYATADGATKVGESTGAGERDVAGNISTKGIGEASGHSPLRALVRLNFLRVAVALAAILGCCGAAILAGFASPAATPRPGVAFLLFLPLAGLIYLAWSSLNWLLSLAGIFAVRDGEDAMGAVAAAATLCRERSGAVFAVGTWTGLAHMVAFVGATSVVSTPLAFVAVVPWRLVVALVILANLAYFALADWLYMARLAGYVCITEMPAALLVPLSPAPQSAPQSPIQTTIDRDEPILSDLPGLA